MSEPRKASDFLAGIVKQIGRKRARDEFAQALDAVLPAAQRPHCEVMGFRDGKLVLEVDSAPLFAELSGFRREEIRAGLNERLPLRQVAQLQFRLGGTGHV